MEEPTKELQIMETDEGEKTEYFHKPRTRKVNWYYAPVFILFWVLLYFAVILTQIRSLPSPLTLSDEGSHPDRFIAERAQQNLFGLTAIGPRVVGSEANEIKAVQYLKDRINKIIADSRQDLYHIELDVQRATGSYVFWDMLNRYQGVQNVVVKLSSKNSTNNNCLLLNSHFDTVSSSPGGGDDGSMVAVIMEVLRVLSISPNPLIHPIVFLFNGAEENPLQASHAFITQHKWAKDIRSLINLDAAGNGGKEVLFQSDSNHPWLMRYYRENAKHPFATTVGEEVFQAGVLPSDTDFRIFRDFGNVPGLDLAYIFNGYVYHTEFDQFDLVPRGTFQHTGDNILAITKALGNAIELDDVEKFKDGHVVFYDFLGWFMIFYTVNQAVIINSVFSVAGLILIGVSLWQISVQSNKNAQSICLKMAIIFVIQIVSVAIAVGLSLLVMLFMDAVGRSLSWFSNQWLIPGLYLCPVVFGLGVLPAFYLQWTKFDGFSLSHKVQMFLHSHSIFLIIILIVLTAKNIRSVYLVTIIVVFYTISMLINLCTTLHNKKFFWVITHLICQLLPILYCAYLVTVILITIIPMAARSGPGSNPDLKVGGFVIVISILPGGLLVPILYLFRKTRTIVCVFGALAVLFIIIAVTPAGFPYKEKTAPQRFYAMHSRRVFHKPDMTIEREDSGFYLNTQDRRSLNTIESILNKKTDYQIIEGLGTCGSKLSCAYAYYAHRGYKAQNTSLWIPSKEQPNLPNMPTLTMQSTKIGAGSLKYNFHLLGPSHMSLRIAPLENCQLVDWTFDSSLIEKGKKPPKFVHLTRGIDNTPYEFSLDFKVNNTSKIKHCLEIGVNAHWVYHKLPRATEFQTFLDIFPKHATVETWDSSYQYWIY